MKIVEIVETLIQMRNERKLPRTLDERTAQEAVLQIESIKAALQDAETTLLKLYGCGGRYCDDEIEAYQQRKKERETV